MLQIVTCNINTCDTLQGPISERPQVTEKIFLRNFRTLSDPCPAQVWVFPPGPDGNLSETVGVMNVA